MTRPRPVTPEERNAYELHRAGVPHGIIARQLHMTERRVQLSVDRVLDQLPASRDQRLDADRLDRLIAALWPQAIGGDVAAAEEIRKLTSDRRRLAGPPQANQGALRKAFDESVTAARAERLISKVDEAVVTTGRTLADKIDTALAIGDPDEQAKAMFLVPHLMNIMKELHITPGARHRAQLAAGGDETAKGGVLRALRAQGTSQAG